MREFVGALDLDRGVEPAGREFGRRVGELSDRTEDLADHDANGVAEDEGSAEQHGQAEDQRPARGVRLAVGHHHELVQQGGVDLGEFADRGGGRLEPLVGRHRPGDGRASLEQAPVEALQELGGRTAPSEFLDVGSVIGPQLPDRVVETVAEALHETDHRATVLGRCVSEFEVAQTHRAQSTPVLAQADERHLARTAPPQLGIADLLVEFPLEFHEIGDHLPVGDGDRLCIGARRTDARSALGDPAPEIGVVARPPTGKCLEGTIGGLPRPGETCVGPGSLPGIPPQQPGGGDRLLVLQGVHQAADAMDLLDVGDLGVRAVVAAQALEHPGHGGGDVHADDEQTQDEQPAAQGATT